MYGSPLRLTGGLRPFTQRIHRRHQHRLPGKGTNYKASTRTGVPACSAIHLALHVFLLHGALWGALQAPYVGPYEVLDTGDKTYKSTIRVLRREPPLTECNRRTSFILDTEPASPPARPPGVTTRSGWRVRFPDFLGCSGLSGVVVWRMLQASSQSLPGHCSPPQTLLS